MIGIFVVCYLALSPHFISTSILSTIYYWLKCPKKKDSTILGLHYCQKVQWCQQKLHVQFFSL